LADKQLIATIDEYYKGDRKKAAEDAAMRGWQFLRQGNAQDAMRRFNQAWLLDKSNGIALWGMGAIEATQGKADSSLKLFTEAEQYIGNDIDFAVDYARTIGLAAVNKKDSKLLNDAFSRFEELHKRAPQNILNLQNWAITLFYILYRQFF